MKEKNIILLLCILLMSVFIYLSYSVVKSYLISAAIVAIFTIYYLYKDNKKAKQEKK